MLHLLGISTGIVGSLLLACLCQGLLRLKSKKCKREEELGRRSWVGARVGDIVALTMHLPWVRERAAGAERVQQG